ncbi:hypothetical protein VIGAN_08291600, partial [Vigna angularis var. angularis]
MEVPNMASSKAYALTHLLSSTYDKHLSIFFSRVFFFPTLEIYYCSTAHQNSPSNSFGISNRRPLKYYFNYGLPKPTHSDIPCFSEI